MAKRKKYNRGSQRRGLILLIVLGMLAMFTLLAVTYVVMAGNSRQGSLALAVRARNSSLSVAGTARNVLRDAIRGTNNQKSPFHRNALLEDVFGINPIRTQFGPFYSATNSVRRFFTPDTGVNLVKLSINKTCQLNGPLSDLENEYNSRILTVLEGPLTGQSFRILKYVGFVRNGLSSGTDADPNIKYDPTGNGTNPLYDPGWADPSYNDNLSQNGHVATDIEYSVLIDLNEVVGNKFIGEYTDSTGTVNSISQSLDKWINPPGFPLGSGLQSLFYFKSTAPAVAPTTATMLGYKLLINDAPFNSAGIGIEDIAVNSTRVNSVTSTTVNPGFGNLDKRDLLSTSVKVPPAILTHYDYLQDPAMMAGGGVDGIGVITRDFSTGAGYDQIVLPGGSNEGYDVADFHDAWLANQSMAGGVFTIKPSYHDPAVVNYVSNLFGSPSSMTIDQVKDMLRLIEASTARIMSYHAAATPSTVAIDKNIGFRQNDPSMEDASSSSFSPPSKTFRLSPTFTWSSPPAAPEIQALQKFVESQIVGPWDVDNDGDGIPDSVWIDPGLQVVFSPDGRRLRPLAAVMFLDMDSRVNLNTSGDRVQGNVGYNAAASIGFDAETGAYYKRASQRVGQGFGYGPGEISLTALFANGNSSYRMNGNPYLSPSGPNYDPGPPTPAHNPNRFSMFDELAGAKHFTSRPIVFPYVMDRVPGIARALAYPSLSYLHEREIHVAAQHNTLPGMPLARRTTLGMTFDRLGNPAFVNPLIVDGNPYNTSNTTPAALPSETHNDRYESAAMDKPISDDPYGLGDMEALVRRFDEDASSLPRRLYEKINPLAGSPQDGIFDQITVRSAELRYPNLVTAMKKSPAGASGPTQLTIEGVSPGKGTPSFLRYIQMLHSQRFRNRSFPANASDDPEISNAALSELFPMDFAKGLRMDLNRAFGDGIDNDAPTDGQVDEPDELDSIVQVEQYPVGGLVVTSVGAYLRDLKLNARKLNAQNQDGTFPSETRVRLGSRQILARNLYCLAQLLIPRDYEFPGMSVPPTALGRARVRAKAIAQWAVNVVDFRDADAAMTRFEYDVLPFGTGTAGNFGSGTAGFSVAKPAYWAPDHIQHLSSKNYIGVVWGMEMPELLLTESIALHDKRLRDTNMDTSGSSTSPTETMPDTDFDQFRFPLASLFLEIYNPRTTAGANSTLIPGVPSSLYVDNGNNMALQLDRMAPPNTTNPAWGAQPVWRIALSEMHINASTDHPQAKLTGTNENVRDFASVTHQWSNEGVTGGSTGDTAMTGASNLNQSNTALTNIEQYIGNDLRYDTSNPSAELPTGFDRFIWFTNTRPRTTAPVQSIPDILTAHRNAGQQAQNVFTASMAGATLEGGSYMVIGPRSSTPIGSMTHNQFSGVSYPTILTAAEMAAPGTMRPVYSPSLQGITLPASGSSTSLTTLLNGTSANSLWLNRIKAPQTMICTVPAPTGWGTPFPNGIGLNISQPTPVAGQTIWTATNMPTRQLNTLDTGAPRTDGSRGYGDMPPDSWIDVGGAITNSLPDEPIDNSNPVLKSPSDRVNTGTYENVRAAYLQRLADPDYPYDPVTNPYITVDWMSIDLTVFNGEAPIGSDPMDPSTTPPIEFQTRYKNGALSPLAASHDVTANNGISYYSPMTSPLKSTYAQTPPASVTVGPLTLNPQSYFPYQLGYDKNGYGGAASEVGCSASTLGYCNVGYYTPAGMPLNANIPTLTSAVFDGFGPPFNDTTNTVFKGAPARIAGITWFNRPFASPAELMMVPLTGPAQFGLYHSAATSVQGRETSNFVPSYQTMNAWNVSLATTPPASPPSLTSYWAKPEALAAGSVRLADWPLLLEFVETQPPFIDANKIYRIDTMYSQAATDNLANRFLNSFLPQGYTRPDTTNNSDLARSEPATVRGPSYLAPFNFKPTYVTAGKLNLNTISFDQVSGHSRALRALEHNYLATERNTDFNSTLETEFANSRQGYGTVSKPNAFLEKVVHPAMHPDYPTRFAGAFRPAMSSNIAPVLVDADANAIMRSRYGVQTTLTRTFDATTNTNTRVPSDLQGITGDSRMLFQASQVESSDRLDATQSFVRMQRAMRLPNLVTNQSNIFAAWVTVSLFEYDPITGFGNEYVGDTGLPERERQFFMIDRTIPVGFKPGEDLNTDRTILLQRKLP